MVVKAREYLNDHFHNINQAITSHKTQFFEI